MKKLLLITAALLAAPVITAAAANGDIAGDIYTTDILTQVDGRDIRGFAIDGKTMIALEELEPYGFTIYYNDNIRTLFVTKTGSAGSDFNPSVQRGVVGGKAGHYYESDIVAYVNGIKIDTYALDGKLAVAVEDLADSQVFYTTRYYNDGSGYGQTTVPYRFMNYAYNDSRRLLSLDTTIKESFNTIAQAQLGATTIWSATRDPILHNKEYIIIPKQLGGLTHPVNKDFTVIKKNGLIYNAINILCAYGLDGYDRLYRDLFDPVLSSDGKRLLFRHKHTLGDDFKQLELDSMHIYPLSESEYTSERYHIENSDYSMTLNGTAIPLYNVGGRDYIRANDMSACGFTVNYDSQEDALNILFRSVNKNGTTTAKNLNGSASPVSTDTALRLNGGVIHNHDMIMHSGEYYLPIDIFTYDYQFTEGQGSVKYSYDVSSKKITAYSRKVDIQTEPLYGAPSIHDTISAYEDYASTSKNKPYKTLTGKDYTIEAYEVAGSAKIYMVTDNGLIVDISNIVYNRYRDTKNSQYISPSAKLSLSNDVLTLRSSKDGLKSMKLNINTFTFEAV